MNRRSLLQALIFLAGALKHGRVRLRAQAGAPSLTTGQLATLHAMATVVLPTALGRRGVADLVDRFVGWLHDYRPGAEMDHGYGFTRMRTTPVSPVASSVTQLDALDRAARARGRPFVDLDADSKRLLIETAVAAANVAELPQRPNGRHVATDLMGFYFFSSEANDLCYDAAIGRDTCRSLDGSSERPVPLVMVRPAEAGRLGPPKGGPHT